MSAQHSLVTVPMASVLAHPVAVADADVLHAGLRLPTRAGGPVATLIWALRPLVESWRFAHAVRRSTGVADEAGARPVAVDPELPRSLTGSRSDL